MITVKQQFNSRFVLIVVFLTLFAGAAGLGISGQKEREKNALANIEFDEIRPGVFVHTGVHEDITKENGGDIANIGFIVGNQSVAVIDPGASAEIATALVASVAKISALPISHVVLTHLHPDHMLGAYAISDSVTLIAHENYPRAMLQRGAFYLDRYADMLGIDDRAMRVVDQLVAVGRVVSIDLGDRELQLQAHPVSHTDNDLSIYDASENVLWASDLIFETRTPSLDGSLIGWLETLQDLEQSYSDSLVIPGHGKPGSFVSIVTRQRQYLELLLHEVRAGIAQNQPLSVAVEGQCVEGMERA